MRVLDVGCGPDGRSFSDYAPAHWDITGIDILPPDSVRHSHPRFSYIRQTAADLSRFGDQSFDLVVCVGMLEHITDEATFQQIARELQRVAKQYLVVVPYRYCWIEPHYGFPFFPLLPYRLQVQLIKALNLNNLRLEVTKDYDYVAKHYRWLSSAEYERTFVGARAHLVPTREMIAIARSLAPSAG